MPPPWTPLKIMPGLGERERKGTVGLILAGGGTALATMLLITLHKELAGLPALFMWTLGWLALIAGVTLLAAANARELGDGRLRFWVLTSGSLFATTLLGTQWAFLFQRDDWRSIHGGLWFVCVAVCITSALIWVLVEFLINHKVKQVLRQQAESSGDDDDAAVSGPEA